MTEITIPIDGSFIHGNLTLLEKSQGLIIFAHGSGSSRFSKRNNFVASLLNNNSFSTLLFDLLTQEEEQIDLQTREFRFNIPLLAQRLISVTQWIKDHKEYSTNSIGYFGASTGAAAALIAAAQLTTKIKAVVSRGGRPDLSHEFLPQVTAPTLLIVGSLDYEVIRLNEAAYNQLTCEKEMILIPGATHLFEESGKLEEVTEYTIAWFKKHL
jgi:putative phosphoribosyl transferase